MYRTWFNIKQDLKSTKNSVFSTENRTTCKVHVIIFYQKIKKSIFSEMQKLFYLLIKLIVIIIFIYLKYYYKKSFCCVWYYRGMSYFSKTCIMDLYDISIPTRITFITSLDVRIFTSKYRLLFSEKMFVFISFLIFLESHAILVYHWLYKTMLTHVCEIIFEG